MEYSSRHRRRRKSADAIVTLVSNTSASIEPDQGDSGVHLEETLSSPRAWEPVSSSECKETRHQASSSSSSSHHDKQGKVHKALIYKKIEKSKKSHRLMNPTTPTGDLENDFHKQCSTGKSSKFRLMKAKSESPSRSSVPEDHPRQIHTHTRTEVQVTTQIKTHRSKSTGKLQSSVSSPPVSPISPDSKDGGKVEFLVFDSESDSEERSTRPIVKTSERSSSAKEKSDRDRETRRARFKKILRPLRRSHSAGCAKDVPAHALFLRHELEKRQKEPEHKPIERMSSNESDNEDGEKRKGSKKKRSLAKDMKQKLGFLRRRHTDTSLVHKYGPDGKSKGSDSVHEWSKSFDTLLQDKQGLDLFRNFLRSEFSEENIEFWIACEDYKTAKSGRLTSKAQQIYSDFVAVQAPREVNLDSKTRLATIQSIEHPNKHTFEPAQKRIQALMEKDSYPRFLRSDTYQALIGEHKVSVT